VSIFVYLFISWFIGSRRVKGLKREHILSKISKYKTTGFNYETIKKSVNCMDQEKWDRPIRGFIFFKIISVPLCACLNTERLIKKDYV
jgi:hypothetical protein